MKTLKLSIILFFGFLINVAAQTSVKPAYLLFDKEGKQVAYDAMLTSLSKADVVLFGEYHNNPICHWLEYELAKDLFQVVGKELVIGSEIFERDDQLILNEYLSGAIKERNFKAETKLWDNYDTDYSAIMEMAKTEEIPFIATNIPRRYASMVANNGLEVLENVAEEAQLYLPKLPIEVTEETPGYQALLEMGGGHEMGEAGKTFMQAQAVKDATMAYSILENWKKGQLFYHFNGDYHSAEYGGIYWYLKQAKKKLKIATISTVESEDMILQEAMKQRADFILLIPASMSKSY